MRDKIEDTITEMDGQDLKDYLCTLRNRIVVLLGFILFLLSMIVVLCAFIYYQEKQFQRHFLIEHAVIKSNADDYNWTEEELLRVTNIRPLILIKGEE